MRKASRAKLHRYLVLAVALSLLNAPIFSAKIGSDTLLKTTNRFHVHASHGNDDLGQIALSGRTALIGADATIRGLQAAGAAYFFTEDDSGQWFQRQRLTDPGVTELDAFGGAVALAGDTALIGASGAGTGDQRFRGAVYAYRRDSEGRWRLKQTLRGRDSAKGDMFGSALALEDDTVLIGVPYGNVNERTKTSGWGEGKAYFFVRGRDGIWKQTRKLPNPSPHLYDNFGESVALDGATAVISAPGADANGIENSGAVYVYHRNDIGVWQPEAKLTAFDSTEDLFFGLSLAISNNTLLVGTKNAIVDGHSHAGAVWVFVRHADGTWIQQAKLTASDAAEDDRFGIRLALEDNAALISSVFARVIPVESHQVYGLIYKFVRDPATGSWTQQQELATSDPYPADGVFGGSLALNHHRALVSATNITIDGLKYADAVEVLTPVTAATTALSLELTTGISTPKAGQTLTYHLRVTNDDAKQAAAHVTITDQLPAGARFAGAGSGCRNADGTVTCDLGTLGPGAVADRMIKITSIEPGQLLNIARVSAHQPERNTRDNIGYATVTVQSAPEPPTQKPNPNNSGGGVLGWLSFIWLGWVFVSLKLRCGNTNEG